MDVPSSKVLGRADNPIRASVDALARKAGLNFIVNVIVNPKGEVVGAVAGDMVAAHRAGCEIARAVFEVPIPKEFDIVIADSFPFDVDLWQANKALDTAGQVVRKDGVVILVSPCHEGFSGTHSEILEFGYRSVADIRELVATGRLRHKVVGVHMAQVSAVAVEKATVVLVSSGIREDQARQAGLKWAATPKAAYRMALAMTGPEPSVAILKNAARMLAIVERKGD
jgi:nickel-dependent lactate racemase